MSMSEQRTWQAWAYQEGWWKGWVWGFVLGALGATVLCLLIAFAR